MVGDSATESQVTANQASQGPDIIDKRSGILSAQLQSLKIDKMNSPTQKKKGVLARLAPKLINFVLGSSTGHEECNTMNLALIEEVHRMVREREHLSSRLRILQSGSAAKDTKLLEKQAETVRFREQAEDLSSRLKILQSGMDAKDMELREKDAEALRFKEQAEEFREIFLAEAGSQKISDDEFVQSFVKLRQRALALAKSKALRFDRKPEVKKDAPEYVKNMYWDGRWDSWKPKDRELRMRQEIFAHIHFILNTACFGIEGFPATKPGETGHIAQGLMDLEAMATGRKRSTVLLANWRLATLELVEALGVQEHWSEYVAEQLWIILDPILDDQSESLKEGIRSLALNLCKDAFNFRIMMRKSRDEYRCNEIEDMVQDPTADVERWAVPHAVDEGANNEAGDSIAYVLFGALTKKSTYHGGDERVLVKAEVVMERKALGWRDRMNQGIS